MELSESECELLHRWFHLHVYLIYVYVYTYYPMQGTYVTIYVQVHRTVINAFRLLFIQRKHSLEQPTRWIVVNNIASNPIQVFERCSIKFLLPFVSCNFCEYLMLILHTIVQTNTNTLCWLLENKYIEEAL